MVSLVSGEDIFYAYIVVLWIRIWVKTLPHKNWLRRICMGLSGDSVTFFVVIVLNNIALVMLTRRFLQLTLILLPYLHFNFCS